jgi:hypothetical protein
MPDTSTAFQSFDQRFDADGLDLVSSPDNGKPPRYPILINVRQVRRGEFRSRPALNAVATAAGKTPWHSVRRLNDKPTGAYALVAGIGTELFTTPPAAASAGLSGGAPVSRDSGYSGNPLCLVPFKPDNDTAEWMAAFDDARVRKVRLDGTVHQLGLPQPTYPPDVGLDWSAGLQRSDIELGSSLVGWNLSNPGGIAPNLVTRTNAQCTVVRALWGDGFDPTGGLASGWMSIEVAAGPPNGLANVGPGTVLTDVNAKLLTVEEIHPASSATTIKSILFDAVPVSGEYCTLVPTAAYHEFQQHAIVRAVGGGSGTNYGVITAVVVGPDNSIAVRVFFESGTPVAGDAIDVRNTIYTYAPNFPVGALTSQAVRYQGLNTVSTQYTLLKNSGGLNLSAYSSGKQVDQTLDEMHIGLQATDWTLVDNIKIQLDIDDGTFQKNFLSRTIRQADLLAFQTNVLGPLDTRTGVIRNDQLDNPVPFFKGGTVPFKSTIGGGLPPRDTPIFDPGTTGPPGPVTDLPGGSSSQGTTGTNQWSEIRFKMSDLLADRFGADISKGLQAVNSLQLVVTRNATIGTLDVAVGSWWIGGGTPPDVGPNAPYEYRFRYRVAATGARSNWSPPSRSPMWPHRYPVYVQIHTSNQRGNPAAPAEVDKIDIQRRGGSVNQWVTIGTVDKSGGDPQWTDVYDDAYALGAAGDPLAIEGNTNDQPFTVQQPAFTDTVTTVSGTLIRHVGGFGAYFSGGVSLLQQGTGVVVNGTATLVYRLISADLMEVFDNVGSGTNLKLEIPSPFVVSRPLPIVFGPVEGWWMACGDPKNPGRLYVFNKDTLDSAQGAFFVDITDPGDPLQNGCAYTGRGYVWSGESMFALVIDTSLPAAPIRFERLVSSVGMYSRYALCVGDSMYWLGKDGIYTSDGGPSHNITTGTLAPLFPSKQFDGSTTNSIPAPLMSYANAAADGTALHQFRLSYNYDKTLWFDYPDGNGIRRSLGMQRASGIGIMIATGAQEQWGWWYDSYLADTGVLFHYSDEGENVRHILCGGIAASAKLYVMGTSTNGDDGAAYTCQVRSFAVNADYPRAQKLFGDAVLDLDPGGGSIAVKLYFDNWASNYTPVVSPITGSGRVQSTMDINSGAGAYALNMALDVVWSITATESPVLYRWGGSVLQRPDDTKQRATDFTDCGYWGPKEFRGADIECSSSTYAAGVATPTAKTIVFDYTKDDGTVGTVAVNVSVREKSIVPIAFAAPVIGYEIRIHPSDANTWKEYSVVQWHFDQLADLTALITPWEGERQEYVQGIELFADTNGAAVVVNVQKDFGATATSFTANHPGRGWKSYSWTAPFLAYLRRLAPTGPIRLMKWRWAAQPEAPLGDVWDAQEFELGDPFGFAQYAEIEYASTSTVTLLYTVDGVLVLTDSTTLTSTGGTDPAVFDKRRVVLPAVKGRLGKLRLQAEGQFRTREKGTGIYRKAYGEPTGFKFTPLLGAVHREQGALV